MQVLQVPQLDMFNLNNNTSLHVPVKHVFLGLKNCGSRSLRENVSDPIKTKSCIIKIIKKNLKP